MGSFEQWERSRRRVTARSRQRCRAARARNHTGSEWGRLPRVRVTSAQRRGSAGRTACTLPSRQRSRLSRACVCLASSVRTWRNQDSSLFSRGDTQNRVGSLPTPTRKPKVCSAQPCGFAAHSVAITDDVEVARPCSRAARRRSCSSCSDVAAVAGRQARTPAACVRGGAA